jgi:branched-chain amino acid transport system ATP-binding protein
MNLLGEIMLEVDRINVYYGDIQVLWDVSLRLRERELVSVLGPNGAGKTTTLKTICGLLRPKSGSIKFLEREIHGLTPEKIVELGITLIPEGRRLFPQMSVEENLLMGAYIKRARSNIDDSLEWIYQLFPVLKERRKQLAKTLSGGEQQMLAIGRGLMSRPKLLMLDEPSLGLAPRLVSTIFKTIDKLRSEGITILLVEQNAHQALNIADRGYILESGKILQEGDKNDLLKSEYIRKAYLGI